MGMIRPECTLENECTLVVLKDEGEKVSEREFVLNHNNLRCRSDFLILV